MPLLLRNLTLGLDDEDGILTDRAARRLRVTPQAIEYLTIIRRSIDARDKSDVRYVYNVEVALRGGVREEERIVQRLHRSDISALVSDESPPLENGTQPLAHRPVIVGFGPAGMFAALWLARFGLKPIVLERGQAVKNRHRDILQKFYGERQFNAESNLLFGEGGAGAYSDGKLFTRVHDSHMREILRVFVDHGAPADILIDSRPHLGSDRIPTLCTRIRQTIESHGGEVRFGARLDDVEISDGVLKSIRVTREGATETMPVGPLLLGVGHSARDTIRMLVGRGVRVTAKPFQLGVRVEHPQSLVNRWQYGPSCNHHRLPPAEYHLVSKGAASSLGDVYSFCMCPGGLILPTNESPGLIATNGASGVQRNRPFANSGIVMTVPVEVIGNDPLRGLEFVERWERRAFELTGATYRVPCQRAVDYLAGRASDGDLATSSLESQTGNTPAAPADSLNRPAQPETSYPLGGAWADIRQLLPDFVADAVRKALLDIDSRMPGFAGAESLITGPESRASAPVRIPRNSLTRESDSTLGLYPMGEGAGYAGGIMSAAADGITTAELLIHQFAPFGS